MRDRPVPESMLRLLSDTNIVGVKIKFDPAATATGASPLRSAWTAWCTAIKLLEHAVLIVIDGPCQLKKYEIRFDKILWCDPVDAYVGTFSGSL
jgi:hypothetical protein